MKIRKLCKVLAGLENLAGALDTPVFDIIDALVGVCFDEEVAFDIKAYIADNFD